MYQSFRTRACLDSRIVTGIRHAAGRRHVIGKRLTEKEKLFCHHMVKLKNPAEAAVRAGYPPGKAENISAKLLGDSGICGTIENLTEIEKMRETRQDALGGLKRVAFGAVNGAVRLLINEDCITDGELAVLDLFNVSEIKRQKGGGLEIKFFDRLKALELLLEWDGRDEKVSGGSIYDAILNSTSIRSPLETDDPDEA